VYELWRDNQIFAPVPAERREQLANTVREHIATYQRALKTPVKIAFGSDTFELPGTNAEELELLVKYGMTPLQALRAGTSVPAELLGLGNEVGSMFTPDDVLAADLQARSMRVHDPLWRMPLWPSYRKRIESHVADLSNMADGNYAGAITAALFLERFVENTRSWVHLDIFAWNDRAVPGRRIGGEATGMRALFDLVESRFGGSVK